LENLTEDDSCCGKGCACDNEAETEGACCSSPFSAESSKADSSDKLKSYAYATLIAASAIVASRIALKLLNFNK
jgi:hypothetical protein